MPEAGAEGSWVPPVGSLSFQGLGVGLLTAVFSQLLPRGGGQPLYQQTPPPAKPLPRASLQKPSLGQHDCPPVQRKTGSGDSGAESPQPCLPLLAATGTNPADLSSQMAQEARGLKSSCPLHGLLPRSAGTGPVLACRWPSPPCVSTPRTSVRLCPSFLFIRTQSCWR